MFYGLYHFTYWIYTYTFLHNTYEVTPWNGTVCGRMLKQNNFTILLLWLYSTGNYMVVTENYLHEILIHFANVEVALKATQQNITKFKHRMLMKSHLWK